LAEGNWAWGIGNWALRTGDRTLEKFFSRWRSPCGKHREISQAVAKNQQSFDGSQLLGISQCGAIALGKHRENLQAVAKSQQSFDGSQLLGISQCGAIALWKHREISQAVAKNR
jgi:hypothetical protein